MSEINKAYEEVETYSSYDEESILNANKDCGCHHSAGEITDTDHHHHGVTCNRVYNQAADVSLPIKVKPYAKMGIVETRCCGEPVVAIRHCGAQDQCGGCDLLVTQTICSKIPIEYGVTTTSGEVTITCRRQADAK